MAKMDGVEVEAEVEDTEEMEDTEEHMVSHCIPFIVHDWLQKFLKWKT